MNRHLYEITDDLIALNDLLESVEGDLSRCGEMEPAVTQWLTSLDAEQGVKLDAYVGLIRQLEMESAAAKAEVEQWATKARSRENRAKYLKDRLKHHLTVTGQTKVQTATGRTISVVNNGGQRPIVWADAIDLDTVPADLVFTRREIDRAKVRESLEAGQEFGFATLADRGTSLRVK